MESNTVYIHEFLPQLPDCKLEAHDISSDVESLTFGALKTDQLNGSLNAVNMQTPFVKMETKPDSDLFVPLTYTTSISTDHQTGPWDTYLQHTSTTEVKDAVCDIDSDETQMKKYAIVEFKEKGSLELYVIPNIWINRKIKKFYYPDSPFSPFAIQNCVTPKETWPLLPYVQIKYETDSYLKATRKEEQLIKVFRGKVDLSKNGLERRKKLLVKKKRALQMRPLTQSNATANFCSVQPDAGVAERVQSLAKDTSFHHSMYCPFQVRLLERIKQSVEETKQMQKEMSLKLDQILLMQSRNEKLVSSVAPDGFSFPVQLEEELENLEEALIDEEFQARLIRYLSGIGGDSVASLVRRILRRVFSTQLALKFNYSGVKGKKCFKILQMRKVLIAAVRNNFDGTSEESIDAAGRKWFANARDRDGGRARRITFSNYMAA